MQTGILVITSERVHKTILNLFLIIMVSIPGIINAQVLETETARFLTPGGFQAGNAFE